MSVEPIGFVTIAIGLASLLLGHCAAAAILIVMSLFGSAAAIIIGSANIQPGHLMLGFVALAALTRRAERAAAFRAVSPGEPGFWLACLTLYGVATCFFLTRILAESTQIIPLGASAYDPGTTVPLGPVSSNLTQAIYLCADLLSFAMIVAIASTRGGFEAVLRGLLAYAVGSVFLALLDLGTYATGTQDLLAFMRNARYTIHAEAEIIGMKRIVGSFTEASSFARSMLGVLGLTGTLWLCGYKPASMGAFALASIALLVLSTSSTGLAGAPVMLLVLYVTALARCGVCDGARFSAAAVLFGPPLVAAAVILVLLDAGASAAVRDYIDLVLLNKSVSDSGVDRASWNEVALQNFLDSWGFGVGIGTARTSSLLVALLANVGLPGAIFYALFAASALGIRRGEPRTFTSDIRLAARNACLGLLIGDLLVSSTVDQGLFFYVLAAVACVVPERGSVSAFRQRRGRLTGATA